MTLKNVTFLFVAGAFLYLAAMFVLDHPSATPSTLFTELGDVIGDAVRGVASYFTG